MRKHKLAFLDIETTGLIVGQNEIIEIGCVVTDRELNILNKFDLKIKPENIENADKVALKINHYNEEDWADALDLKTAMQKLAKQVDGCILVGQNVAFDSGFIEHAFNKTGVKNTLHYHKLDTISMAWVKLREKKEVTHFSLRDLCKYFGIENENPHSGLGDAMATYELYKKLISI